MVDGLEKERDLLWQAARGRSVAPGDGRWHGRGRRASPGGSKEKALADKIFGILYAADEDEAAPAEAAPAEAAPAEAAPAEAEEVDLLGDGETCGARASRDGAGSSPAACDDRALERQSQG